MSTSDEPNGSERPEPEGAEQTGWRRLARRYGPFVAVAVVVLAAVVVFRGGEDEGESAAELVTDRETLVRSGPTTPEKAELLGEEFEHGPNCDPETGRIMLPTFYAPPCVEAFEGDNGGATRTGVTEDTVKLVLYIPKEDFLVSMVGGQGVDFDPTDTIKAAQDLVDLYNQVFETYGRQVELEVYEGRGASNDLAQAQSDAIAIAEMEPFAVLGGPFLGNIGDAPFVDELAARGVVCLPGCAGSGLFDSFVEERAPYVWPDGMTAGQGGRIAGEAIGTVAGPDGTAELAGDPELHDQERVYGVLYPETGGQELLPPLREELARHGGEIKEEIEYSMDVSVVQEDTRSIVVRLQNAGVTTVIVTGAPFTPGFLTNAATQQGYHPEWILGPSYFADTRLFASLTDQDQWVNGFGLGYKVTAHTAGVAANGLYEWAYGDDAVEIPTSTPYIESSVRMLFTGMHLAGPDLTPESFRNGLFRFPPSGDGVTASVLSWGDHGLWPDVDYGDGDDVSLIWWDPEATSHPDEEFAEPDEEGFYRLAHGGQRYGLGEFPESADAAGLYQDDSSVLMYELPYPPEIEELFNRYQPPDRSG